MVGYEKLIPGHSNSNERQLCWRFFCENHEFANNALWRKQMLRTANLFIAQ
jgi:hypothetical protein